LKASNGGCRGGHGWNNATSLQFDLKPIHRVKLVALSPAIAHRAHEVNMKVAIIIFFEFFWLEGCILESFARWWLLKGSVELDKLFSELLNIICQCT